MGSNSGQHHACVYAHIVLVDLPGFKVGLKGFRRLFKGWFKSCSGFFKGSGVEGLRPLGGDLKV